MTKSLELLPLCIIKLYRSPMQNTAIKYWQLQCMLDFPLLLQAEQTLTWCRWLQQGVWEPPLSQAIPSKGRILTFLFKSDIETLGCMFGDLVLKIKDFSKLAWNPIYKGQYWLKYLFQAGASNFNNRKSNHLKTEGWESISHRITFAVALHETKARGGIWDVPLRTWL